MHATPIPGGPSGPCSPCDLVSPCGPCCPVIRIVETPTEIALAAKMAITIPATNFPIVIETGAITLTYEELILSA